MFVHTKQHLRFQMLQLQMIIITIIIITGNNKPLNFSFFAHNHHNHEEKHSHKTHNTLLKNEFKCNQSLEDVS
ncbi:protein of unknown function [Xenorhabdus doucetiae]|uniref:Uncharacterized protein n=1 Tax=Xenorhabdus doucetiae TaxID=351671 RepID=A0A068QRQ1_9GAMM|nr:protein of unknown function [Xenorhabdus doucetiae]